MLDVNHYRLLEQIVQISTRTTGPLVVVPLITLRRKQITETILIGEAVRGELHGSHRGE